MTNTTVLRTARGPSYLVGRDKAVEKWQHVNCTQDLLGRFSKRLAIHSSWEYLCGWQIESICLERDGWESITVTSGPSVLPWGSLGTSSWAGWSWGGVGRGRHLDDVGSLDYMFPAGPSFSCSGGGLGRTDGRWQPGGNTRSPSSRFAELLSPQLEHLNCCFGVTVPWWLCVPASHTSGSIGVVTPGVSIVLGAFALHVSTFTRRPQWTVRKPTFATSGPRATDTMKCGVRGLSFLRSWLHLFDWSYITAVTFMRKAPSSFHISASDVRLLKFFNKRHGYQFSRREKIWKPVTLPPPNRHSEPTVDRKPYAVLGTSIRISTSPGPRAC
jgi:hypothetical protein